MEGVTMKSFREINRRLEWTNYNGVINLTNYKALLYCILFEQVDVDCSLSHFGLYESDRIFKVKPSMNRADIKAPKPSRKCKRVACFDAHTGEFIKAYGSLTEASIDINRNKATLSGAITNGTKCANLMWGYIDSN